MQKKSAHLLRKQPESPLMAATPWNSIKGKPFVTVTPDGPDDGGDFGPKTPGTRTAGILEALAKGKAVYVSAGAYHLPSSFPGMPLGFRDTLTFDPNALVYVPNNYSGPLFLLADGSSRVRIAGGTFGEDGTPQRRWTSISMASSASKGIMNCWFEDMVINNPRIAVDLRASSTGFVNANSFKSLRIFTPVVGVNFAIDDGATFGIRGNYFEDVQIESSTVTTHGFKDIQDLRNVFVNCAVYDLPAGACSANVASGAQGTVILGGIMTNLNFVDGGKKTRIVDSFQD